MSNFNHLAKLAPRMQPRAFRLAAIPWDPPPSLMVLPATADNPPLWRAAMKLSKGRSARALLDRSRAAANRDEDRELYARHVVVGWDGIQDSDGKQVAFSVEECQAFLQALPDYIFDEVRLFCGDPANFVDDDALGRAEEEALGEG